MASEQLRVKEHKSNEEASNQVEMIAETREERRDALRDNDDHHDHSIEPQTEAARAEAEVGAESSLAIRGASDATRENLQRLMQIVESAESKLMRRSTLLANQKQKQQQREEQDSHPSASFGLLTDCGRKFAPTVTNDNNNYKDEDEDSLLESKISKIRRRAQLPVNDDLDADSPRSGPTPTNDLIRSLIRRDQSALEKHEIRRRRRRRYEDEDENEDEEDEDEKEDAADDDDEKEEENKEVGEKTRASRQDSPDSDLSGALIGKCQLLSRCCQDDAQVVASSSSYLEQVGAATSTATNVSVTELAKSSGNNLRRHSTYLFPVLLSRKRAAGTSRDHDDDSSSSSSSSSASASASATSASTSNSSSDDQDGCNFYNNSDNDHHHQHQANNLDLLKKPRFQAGKEKQFKLENQHKLTTESGRRRLRSSASSPSALATPTNNEQFTSCSGSCCRPTVLASSTHLGATTQPSSAVQQQQQQQRRSSAGLTDASHTPVALRARKRHSLFGALSGRANLFAGQQQQQQQQQHTSGSGSNSWRPRRSLECITEPGQGIQQQQQQRLQQQQNYDPLIPESGFKIVLMGTSNSGKTSIIQRFLYNSFNWRHNPTVEDTYFIEFPYRKNLINISVSDTSGTYQFPAMRRLAINSGDAFILVYSVNNPRSFEELEQLRQTILDEREQAYLEASASLTSNSDVSTTSSSSGLASSAFCDSSSSQPQQQHQLHPGSVQDHHSNLSPSRHWSLASIFSGHHHANHQHQHQPQPNSTSYAPSNQAKHHFFSSQSSSYCSSSSCSSSTDNSRRSSISAAEAALKTRRTRHPPMVIVANKYDLPMEQHLVNSDEIEALVVIDWNNGFVRASAALNLNIDEIFQQVLKQARQPPTLTEALVSKRRKSLPPKLPNS